MRLVALSLAVLMSLMLWGVILGTAAAVAPLVVHTIGASLMSCAP